MDVSILVFLIYLLEYGPLGCDVIPSSDLRGKWNTALELNAVALQEPN